jgi:hypothetical protein
MGNTGGTTRGTRFLHGDAPDTLAVFFFSSTIISQEITMSRNISEKLSIEPLMTRAQVAQALSVHINTVDNWSRQKKLRPVRLGGGKKATVRFRPADIQAFMAGE